MPNQTPSSGSNDSHKSGPQLNYKETLNLPVTEFPMKGGLPEREPQMVAAWTKQNLYKRILDKNKGRPNFTMPDGPPYANGNIHIGHVLNKCLKDFVIKYKNMSGYTAAFIPGWDCHGLPIEHKVTKDLGPKRREKTEADIRQLCRESAMTWVNKQREQFVRLGILAEWENPYLTMAPQYEAEEVRELARVLKNGILYRGEKPVYWCPTLQTALAEAEVEYHTHKSHSIYVKFPLKQGLEKFGAKIAASGKPVSVVIWTTTPWTLPANLGVAVHPDFTYEFFDSGSDVLLVAQDLREFVEKETGLKLTPTGVTAKGSAFERMEARHPFYDRVSLFVLGDHVTLEAGTGIVHTAPGHGQEDYQVGLKYGLKIYSPVDPAGRYTADVAEYQGVSIFEANPKIVERLQENGSLLAHKIFEHQYPHNWRSQTPLIFRATPQWFMAMDKDGHNVRQKALAVINRIRFVPAWGENRLRAMVENRPDWVLSRQRIWGVPIPVFYCRKCEWALVDGEVMNRVADAMEKEDGIEAYHRHPESTFTAGHKCGKCDHTEFRRGLDILDVWFDSGVCHASVQKRREGMKVPADIYLEGSDQHRGWFQTSLLSALGSHGETPFIALVTHGFVNDAKGRKMSKSLGNVVEPEKIWSQQGAEILRLWCAYEDYGQDISCGDESFARVTETYRRFRNTMRFLLGNLHGFEPRSHQVPFKDMTVLDRWALGRLNELVRKVTDAYDNYEFYKVYHALNLFFTVDLSAGYLDMLKDRLYTAKRDGVERRSAQTVLYQLLTHLLPMMAPITSFLSEETWAYVPGDKSESVFLSEFPKVQREWDDARLSPEIAALFEIRSDVSKKLEDLRREKVIGSGLDARVTVTADGERHALLEKYRALLCEFFIVSQVELKMGNYNLSVEHASGTKCERCWYFDEKTGSDHRFVGVCPKCAKALG